MRDWRKIILITLSIIAWLAVVGTLVYLLVSNLLKEERPPLDVSHAYIVNYKWEYDNINLKEYWVNFNIRSGWDIYKKNSKYIIKGDKHSLEMEIIPFNTSVLHTNDSLKKYENESIKYTQLDSIELNWDYNEAYGKKRWDIYIDKNSNLIRVLKETTFKNNDIPVWSIEVLNWKKEEIYKIYITYLWKIEQEQIKNKYLLDEDDKSKGLEYHKYFQANNWSDFSYDVIWFWGVFNSIESKSLNSKILHKTNLDFQKKYWLELEEDEKLAYMELINKDKNRFFNAITFKRIIIENDSIYIFTYETLWNSLELVNIFNNNYENFYFKDIKITKPEVVLWGKQDTFNNIQFIIPISHIKQSEHNTKDKYLITPAVKIFKNWSISIKTNRKESRNETIDDVYKKNVAKYITDSLSISNKTISNVELVKSDDINLWGFEWKWNIFKFETVNNNDVIYIEYILFDTNKYYTIWFSYWEDEIELKNYFDEFIKSINKIN